MYLIDAGYHEKRLLHHLLDNYNVLERPVVNESDPLQLSFGLTLMQIIDVINCGRRLAEAQVVVSII
uniref:Neurotransmitter-gated ion-channel ligand-binding domain-containing protein n=1 Tax=Anopheles quadriannulatus TaxID=34691 RepID=A0A182XGP8_ANOQN